VEKQNPSSKIFCVGNFKTGTTSYSMAMRMLGFRDIHFPLKYVEHLMAGGETRWDVRPWDSMSNMNEIEYPLMDEAYPDSKFVLTTRNVDRWLVSIQKHMATKWPTRLKKLLDWRSELVFGVPCEIDAFDEAHFRQRFLKHREEVRDYFFNKPGRLLVLPLESPTKMEDLSRFLGKHIPYPRMNATPADGFASPGIPVSVENATKEGYPHEIHFLRFEEEIKWG